LNFKLKDIQRKIGEMFLKKELTGFSRERGFKGFPASSTIGIIFNATDAEEFELVKKYVKYLRDLKKKVKTIGYFEQRDIPDMTYSKIEYDFFSKRDLNWHQKPIKPFIDNFLEEEYDILIDLNIKDLFPLKYIASLSKAKFKIGRFAENIDLYDLMIEMEQEKGLKFFLKNLDNYLLQIKTKDGQ
jgi:hypothetical protein